MALYYQRETDKDTDEDSVGEGKEALMLLYCTWKTSQMVQEEKSLVTRGENQVYYIITHKEKIK